MDINKQERSSKIFDKQNSSRTTTTRRLELSFVHECQPILVKYTVSEYSVTFSWKSASESSNGHEFRPFGTLATRIDQTALLFSSASNSRLFCFHILNRSQNIATSKNKSIESSTLDASLWDHLFPFADTKTPILLIGTHDGYLYWSSLATTRDSPPRPLDLLINTQLSAILDIGTFSSRAYEENPFDTTKKSSTINYKNNNNNCLYIVSKSGKLYVYSTHDNDDDRQPNVSYKICILPHFIVSAVRHTIDTTDYLVYWTTSCHHHNEIFAVRFVECFLYVNMRATFIKKFHSIQNLSLSKLIQLIFVFNLISFNKFIFR